MRNAKKWVIMFLALMPLLWFFLTVTTGLMGARLDIKSYNFGSIHPVSGTAYRVEYTDNSPAQAILDPFIPAGISLQDLTGALRALVDLATTISSVTFPGIGLMPNTYILIAVLYLFYLFVISLLSIIVDFLTLPIRLVSGWLDSMR